MMLPLALCQCASMATPSCLFIPKLYTQVLRNGARTGGFLILLIENVLQSWVTMQYDKIQW